MWHGCGGSWWFGASISSGLRRGGGLVPAGELLMMDNRRLLHGRTGFDPGEGVRYLQGCYIDMDGPRSLYRVVRRRLAAGQGA